MKKSVIIVFLFFVTTQACKKIVILPEQKTFDYSYFPIKNGAWKIFQVTEINIDNPSNVFDTLEYFILHRYEEYYVDATKDSMLIISRFYRKNSEEKWKKINRWYAGIKENKAIQVEENIKYVKQNYPLELHKQWNGNVYNHSDTLNKFVYKIVALDTSTRVNNKNFDSVLIVNQRNFSSAVEKYFYQESYAKHIGLIKKQEINIYSERIESIPIEERISKGRIFTMKIIDFGKK